MSGFSIDFDSSDFSRITDAWSKAPEIVTQELKRAMHEATQLLQGEIQERTPAGAYEALRASILAGPIRASNVGVLGVVGTPLSYAQAVEFGSKPHYMGKKAIEGSLMDWVMKKLGKDEKEAKGIAYAIANVKARSSTLGKFMFRDGFKDNKSQVEEMFKQANVRIAQRLAGIPDA